MHLRHHASLTGFAGLALGLAASAGVAFAELPKAGPARTGITTPSEAIQAPKVAAEKATSPAVRPTAAKRLAPAGLDKGSYYTNAGDGVGTLTALERAKLDMARAAVDLARRSGTLYRPLNTGGAVIDRDQAATLKLEQEKTRTPVSIESAPAAGVGTVSPIQLVGPPGLSPLEQAKVEAAKQGRTLPPAAVRPAAPQTKPYDAGVKKTGKEGR